MIGFELGLRTGDELLRFIRALGQHRYVASRLHLIHVFALEALAGTDDPALVDAAAWAKRSLSAGGGAIDLGSKDERLFRRASDAELLGVLQAFWGADGARAKAALKARLESIDALPKPDALPFHEEAEDEMFPILIDAGWELLPLAHLDFERHKGAIQSFSDFEVARFEEESAIPPIVTLHELPSLGGAELLQAFDDDGVSRAPFVLWQDGNETYLDYVLRGLLRASKLADLIETE